MTRIRTAIAIVSVLALGISLSQCGKPQSAAQNFGYEVAVTFTPAAAAKMKDLDQKAVVEGYYFGAPTEATKRSVNDEGQINLGQDESEITATDQTVRISGGGLEPKMLPNIDGKPSVTIRAYSSPKAGTENQLSCTSYTGPLETAQAKPVDIHCDIARAQG